MMEIDHEQNERLRAALRGCRISAKNFFHPDLPSGVLESFAGGQDFGPKQLDQIATVCGLLSADSESHLPLDGYDRPGFLASDDAALLEDGDGYWLHLKGRWFRPTPLQAAQIASVFSIEDAMDSDLQSAFAPMWTQAGRLHLALGNIEPQRLCDAINALESRERSLPLDRLTAYLLGDSLRIEDGRDIALVLQVGFSWLMCGAHESPPASLERPPIPWEMRWGWLHGVITGLREETRENTLIARARAFPLAVARLV